MRIQIWTANLEGSCPGEQEPSIFLRLYYTGGTDRESGGVARRDGDVPVLDRACGVATDRLQYRPVAAAQGNGYQDAISSLRRERRTISHLI